MQAVGLFEAKTHLSQYVARAEAGEEVIIMRHNKPVARIVPMAGEPQRETTFDPIKRKQAIQAMHKLREELRQKYGNWKPGEIVAMVRKNRDERGDHILRTAALVK